MRSSPRSPGSSAGARRHGWWRGPSGACRATKRSESIPIDSRGASDVRGSGIVTWDLASCGHTMSVGPPSLRADRRSRPGTESCTSDDGWRRTVLGHEVHQARQHRPRRVTHLPRLHELRRVRSGHARLVARRGDIAARSSSRPSTPASTSSTPPTCTRSAPARSSSGGRWPTWPTATRSCWPPRSTGRCGGGQNAIGLSRKAIMAEIDHSLRRLGTDYVDLYQIHRWDHRTPIEETMEALHDVVKAGKARYIGASSMWAWQFSKAQYVAEANGWTKFVSMQNHYNLIQREEEREMMPLCVDQGVGVIPWSPLARGRLTRGLGRVDGAVGNRRVRQDAVLPRRQGDRRSGRRDRRRARGVACAGGAGLDARQAIRDVADRRRHQAAATSTMPSPRSSSN